jgi:hypothetical protein
MLLCSADSNIFTIWRIHSCEELNWSLPKFWIWYTASAYRSDHISGIADMKRIAVWRKRNAYGIFSVCWGGVIWYKSWLWLGLSDLVAYLQHTVIPLQHLVSFGLNLVSRSFEFQVTSHTLSPCFCVSQVLDLTYCNCLIRRMLLLKSLVMALLFGVVLWNYRWSIELLTFSL